MKQSNPRGLLCRGPFYHRETTLPIWQASVAPGNWGTKHLLHKQQQTPRWQCLPWPSRDFAFHRHRQYNWTQLGNGL